MREPNDGAQTRPTDQDAQQLDNSPDLEDAVVAAGGATVSQQMKLHVEGCPCLGNAVEVREPTEGERRSREWCKTCTDGTEQTPNFDAYNALANADADDIDRGDGIETDGGHEPPTVRDRLEAAAKQLRLAREHDDVDEWDPTAISALEVNLADLLHRHDNVDRGDGIETDGGRDSPKGALRITLDRDDIMALLDDGTRVLEKDVGPITVNLRTHQRFEPVVLVAGRNKDPAAEPVDGGNES